MSDTAGGLATQSPLTRALGVTALASSLVVILLGLVTTPPDVIQGDAVRMLYIHVPSITLAYVAFFVTWVASVGYLIPRFRKPRLDQIAGASAEVGVVFTGLFLISGMIWGKLTWGTYWQWDARLTTTALLFVLYLGYLALRRLPSSVEVRGKRSAIVALIAFVNVPITHYSVTWWRTLHQGASLKVVDSELEGDMLFALFFGMIAFALIYGWAFVHRFRLQQLEDANAALAVQRAVARRMEVAR